jgi:predicted 3-demethylubiquinone-9 3-methyltransferase (glyoxalase superfamily)
MIHPVFPCLWLPGDAKKTAAFYCSVFKDSEITLDFELATTASLGGKKFSFLNARDSNGFNPTQSFFVIFTDKEELISAHNNLREHGSDLMPLGEYPWSRQYAWIQDRLKINWQLFLEDSGAKSNLLIPSLMFTGSNNGKAEEAINYYTKIFPQSGIDFISRYGQADNDIEGNINHARFSLSGTLFAAHDSSMMKDISFNDSISFVAECDTQDEIDYLWKELTLNGKEGNCGWLTDKFGVSWQVIPANLGEALRDSPGHEKNLKELLKMKKIIMSKLSF